jgi:hypothetical protein
MFIINKNKIKICIVSLILFSVNITLSQNSRTILAIGANFIDDSFTSNYNPLNIDEQWQIGKIPSYISISSTIAKNTNLGFAISTNDYSVGKLVNGSYLTEKMDYLAIDILFQYKIIDRSNNFSDWSFFEPYINLGIGSTKLGNSDFITLNYGFGFYLWIPKAVGCNCSWNNKEVSNFGFIFNTIGKSSFKQNSDGNQIQHSIGICYQFN